jgi:two-component SAPR family response regulator
METQAKIKVLVIDDNPDMLNWFNLLNTKDSPFIFYPLQNEMNVVTALVAVKPEVIFLDISLNTLDGPLIASIIHGNNFNSNRIISMSAEPRYKKAIDPDNFLIKPLTKDVVLSKIKQILHIQ